MALSIFLNKASAAPAMPAGTPMASQLLWTGLPTGTAAAIETVVGTAAGPPAQPQPPGSFLY